MDKGKRWYDEALRVACVFVSVRWLLFEHKLGTIFGLREAGGKVLPGHAPPCACVRGELGPTEATWQCLKFRSAALAVAI